MILTTDQFTQQKSRLTRLRQSEAELSSKHDINPHASRLTAQELESVRAEIARIEEELSAYSH